ncbi:hypothetical protein U472_14665 [Orenia metallireducens]|uniref:Uncharacterized protein n=1 Tax=Orenia metallireducens TaxID=1413210 RepID=A0A1C0A5Z9_9FIRM|nr:hypothetical protein [Orenia metallireducens]OCL25571.1 hypothetical protein U472_14665 [Orenia metallireducens]
MGRILILSAGDMIFHRELKENLLKRGINVRTFVNGVNSHYDKMKSDIKIKRNFIMKIPKLRGIYMLIKTFFILLNVEEKVINLHSIDKVNYLVLYFFTFFTDKKIVLTFYGSDFYRRTDKEKRKLEKLISKVYKINFTNEEMRDEFDKFFNYKYSDKLFIVRFGLKNLEVIREIMSVSNKAEVKAKLGISAEKIVVTCGYGAIKEHQHEKIIEQLVKLDKNIKEKILCLFPMTYGYDKKNRINKIKGILEKTDLNYMVLEDYLVGEDLGNVRVGTDIMINLQTTDQFSGSMQEHIFAGNYIITGKWLPYDTFINMGISLFRISSFSNLNDKIIKLISLIEKKNDKENITENQKIIWELSGWENNIIKWIELYK